MPLFTKYLLALLALLSNLSLAQPALQYQILVDPEDADQLKVSLDTHLLDSFSMLPSRTMVNNSQPHLRCLDRNGKVTEIEYLQPSQCERVEWSIHLQSSPSEGFEVSAQVDSRDVKKGWYFVSEWNSLPRVKGLESSLVCTPNNSCYKMPSITQPPLLLVWGQETTTLDINGKQVLVHSDTSEIMQKYPHWKPTLENQLKYLNNVFPNANLKEWQLAFFARDKNSGSVGGAAGNSLLLINALLENGKLTDDSLQMLLKITAHESVHLMDTRSIPIWIKESLAEYYAMKSLRNTQFETEDPTQQWHQFSTKFPLSKTGLVEANRRYSEQQESQYYPLFYFKGAAFWNDVDFALKKKGTSLDTLLDKMTFKGPYQLSTNFTVLIEQHIGTKQWQLIRDDYL